ncbi:MAG: anhydro-N-acetylmuramic acid kinase, partial [Caulobacteraceae bacterium]
VIEAAIAAARDWPWGAPEPPAFALAARAVAELHLAAAEEFLREVGLARKDIDFVGAHGQTVLHQPPTVARPIGRTVQLLDADHLARGLDLPVAHDFRAADMAAGGQGAPLAPVYHRALAAWSKMNPPVAVLNLGGVGNITLIGEDGALTAFDTGPANGMIDLWVQARTANRRDEDGALARAGTVDEEILADYLDHAHFAMAGPKSLDRFEFSLEPIAGLSLEDGAATLTAFAAEAVARGVLACSPAPRRVIVCGGGRQNPTLMHAIRKRLALPVSTAETVGWRGDSIEAEAFAFLAARTFTGLPITYPDCTGVREPMPGGRIARP